MSKLMRLTGLFLMAALVPGVGEAQETEEVVQTSVVLSGDEAALELELSGGRSLKVLLVGGRIYIDGDVVGNYEPGGELEVGWRQMLHDVSEGEFDGAWTAFPGEEYGTGDAAALEAIQAALQAALATVPANMAAEAGEIAREATMAAAALQEAAALAAQEAVEGGLIVELTEIEGLAHSLGRIGLVPALSDLLNGALQPPLRIVLEADEYSLPEGARVDGSLWLVETDAVLAGTVAGNVFVADGSLIIAPSALVEGDLIMVDAIITDQGGTILGQVRDLEAVSPVVVAPVPVRRRIEVVRRGPSILSNIGRGVGTIMQTLAGYLIFCFVGALVVYFFRGQLETVSDTVSFAFGRSFLTGAAAQVLFFPILLVMAVLILPILVIPFYVVGFALAALLGYLAVAHAAGENLTRKRYPSWVARMRRSNSYYYVFNGLAVLMAFFALAGVAEMGGALLAWTFGLLIAAAMILTWVAGTAGLGAALLSRGGTQRKYARPRQVPAMPIRLPTDSLEQELEPIERRARASQRPQGSQEESDEA